MPHTPHSDSAAVAVDCAVLTVSDTRTVDTDKSGQLIQAKLHAAKHRVVAHQIAKDDPEQVRRLVQSWITNDQIAVVLVNGGTGIAALVSGVPEDLIYSCKRATGKTAPK
ncbi:molybdopterin-binding protein [Oscillatoria sp. CS-180]|uniref:MogA/MoaB family molybdenum cofactor biosynthesis protein n=1 Tax=Oscillatoria sp. CS-180 TaxID=3021720 RepID=UPI00232D0C3B|nr:molybdopterin-binding protein [Oscillatoria sp. CS-180]MDB9527540.1 molybdopterin-binding protein [Oscillatoria sp. CS-180]